MKVEERRLLSFDALPLFYRHISPDGPSAASMLLIHGMWEHSGRYLDFATTLAGAGIDCLVPDLRGFGQSGGRRGDVGRFEYFIRDLEALYAHLERASTGRPVFLFGHSFGAFLAARLAAFSPTVRPRGIVLTSLLAEAALPVPTWKKVLAQVMSRVYPIYSERAPLEPNRLTHDVSILQRDAKDPLIHHQITSRLYVELTHALHQKEVIARKLRCPMFILQAGDDHVVSSAAAELFFNEIASKDKQFELLSGLYHEVLNEVCRQSLYSKIIAWIISRSK